jgi:signal transduction histidine kinase
MTGESTNRTLMQERHSDEEKLNQILFVIHHNLRGPLCSVQGLLQCIDVNTLNSDQLQVLDWIAQKCREMNEATITLSDLMENCKG